MVEGVKGGTGPGVCVSAWSFFLEVAILSSVKRFQSVCHPSPPDLSFSSQCHPASPPEQADSFKHLMTPCPCRRDFVVSQQSYHRLQN